MPLLPHRPTAAKPLLTSPATEPAAQPNRNMLTGALGAGLIAGLFSSLCCLPAAVAFALGLSGSSFLVGLGLYRPYFLAAGVGFAALAIWWSLRRSQHCCSLTQQRRNRLLIPALTLVTLGVSYELVNLVLLPWLYR